MKRTILFGLLTILVSTSVFAEEVKVKVNGMVCAFCAQGIEHALKEEQTVEHVKVDLDSGVVTIHTHDKQAITDKTIDRIITDAGFTVESVERK